MSGFGVLVNETFGPTLQGEGPDIGRPCYFLRLHGCPVKCPGCDTAYTWNGSEKGKKTVYDKLQSWATGFAVENPHCGLVVSGGEPLIHSNNEGFQALIRFFRQHLPWVSVETSGFGSISPGSAVSFLRLFSTVSLSPKVTPCLHGAGWSYEELTREIETILNGFAARPRDLYLKMVARDEEDLKVVDRVVADFGIRHRKHTIYIMPYGVERDEVLGVCDTLVPLLASRGYVLTPRLHSLLWGKRRGV